MSTTLHNPTDDQLDKLSPATSPIKGFKHGMSKDRLFFSWYAMHRRCTDKNHRSYRHYGHRGISVCKRWSEFANFFADMGNRPDGMSLGRINNDGDYCPENCRWETASQQASNKTTTRRLTAFGRTQTLLEWSLETGFPMATIHTRITRGYTVEDAVSKPRFFRKK